MQVRTRPRTDAKPERQNGRYPERLRRNRSGITLPTDQVHGADQNQSAHRRHGEKCQTTFSRNSESLKKPLTDDRANQAEYYIGEDSVAAPTHQLAGGPSCNQTDDYCSEQMQTAIPSPGRQGIENRKALPISSTNYQSGSPGTTAAWMRLSLFLLFHRSAAAL
jgi:hypothetical protein